MVLIAALIVAGCAVVSGARLVGVSRSPLPQLAALAPWTIFGWAAALVLLAAARSWWFAAVVLILLIVQVSWVWPTRAAQAAAEPRAEAVVVRVMTVNAFVGAADADQMIRIARADQVDLLVVEEVLPDLAAGLSAGLGDELPHLVRSDPETASGTMIWSRWPIHPIEPSLGAGRQIARALLHVPGAVPLTVTGVHTMSPGHGRIAGWAGDLDVLVRASARTTGAHLLLGDFNATRDHQPFRRLLATGLVDAAETMRTRPWRGVTWPANKRWLPAAVRLDHVLVTPSSVGVRAVRVVPIAGSDHRGIRADLELTPKPVE